MIRLVHIPTIVGAATFARCLADLPQPEQDGRNTQAPAQRRRVIAHAVLRRFLGKHLHIAPRHVRLQRQAMGKPVLAQTATSTCEPLHFSLSYSGDQALLALAASPVGVDIESVIPDGIGQIARHVYTDTECQRLQGTDAAKTFLDIWSAKEAVLKFLGTGLHVDPRQICVPPARQHFQTVCIRAVSAQMPSCVVATWRIFPASAVAVSMAQTPSSIIWEHYAH